jgi:hypothetical protein
MDALDGNAVAGELELLFGRDMTTAMSSCGGCGATAAVAEIAIYLRAPGFVGRCRSCDRVLLVLAPIRDVMCVDFGGFADVVG